MRQRYVLFDKLCDLSSQSDCMATLEARRAIADSIEYEFISWITLAAKQTLGMKSIPLVHGSRKQKSELSEDCLNAREELRSIFLELRSYQLSPMST